MTESGLKVTSHVARDLIQSAQLFQHEHSVVWEYVSNGLEYIDPGTRPIVDVNIDPKARRITIRDNGRGMARTDLERYFQMHGENQDRKRGKAGRGLFGTGKSAAFGIANSLTITTVRNGKRSRVKLLRRDIDAASDGDPIPVQLLESELPTSEANGTLVEIDDVYLKRMDVGSVIRHIERHIAHWPSATVIVNHQECRVDEPPYSNERRFTTKDTPFSVGLGEVELIVKVAKAPLDSEWQGIAVLSDNVWHTTTLAGCENKPFSNYLFGEVNVPALASNASPIPAFDMSRSMRLNMKNETAAQLISFIGSRLEVVRKELEEQDRERKRDRDAKRLAEEADAIAKIINQDFSDWRNKVQRTLAKAPGGADQVSAPNRSNEGDASLSPGPDVPAIIAADQGGPDSGSGGGGKSPGTRGPKLERSESNPETTGSPRNAAPRGNDGGFQVDFIKMGSESARAKYERGERTIYVNLDHPQITAALSIGGVDDVAFRRLAYEVAFCEYAIALASELAGGDWYQDVTDPIFDIRDTLNRISVTAASLYAGRGGRSE